MFNLVKSLIKPDSKNISFYLVVIVGIVAVIGLLLLIVDITNLNMSNNYINDEITGEAVGVKKSQPQTSEAKTAQAQGMESESTDEMESETSDEMESETTDEFTSISTSSLQQGAYYSITLTSNSMMLVKNMKDSADFSIAYDAMKQGYKNNNYGVAKTLKSSQLEAGITYIVYYSGGDYFSFVRI